ncbi:MAG: hypothetical protein M3R13_11055 [Armatimonadota bacterium]|nr:hypothetical protein [Armatimonadota bacterium]
MHRLIASTDPFFGLIKQFATAKGQQFDDWSNSDRASVIYSPKVLGMRGYIAAVEGDYEEAEEMVKLIHKTSKRAIATGIGQLPNLMAIRWSNIICAELAFRTSENKARMNQVVSLINDQPRIDHKATLGEELSAYLAHIDAVDAGTVSYGPPTSNGLGFYDFNRTNRAMGKTRVDVLRAFIDGFDKWNQRDTLVSNALSLVGKSFHDEMVSTAVHGIAWAKQREIDQDAADRAIRLTVAAYAARGATGVAPTVATLAKAGIETVDPWTDKPFTLEFEGNRIFVVGIRSDRTRGIVNKPQRIIEPAR